MLIVATPRPPITGAPPENFSKSSGAQNLSGGPRFLPAHWGLASPKLQRLRFHNCACRTRPPGRTAYICGPASVRPLRKGGTASVYAVGAAHWAARLQGFALRGEFLFPVEKEPKDAGGRRRGELCSPMTAFPQAPITRAPPEKFSKNSGAQNLSGGPRFLPAHWGLASPKLQRLRFHNCAPQNCNDYDFTTAPNLAEQVAAGACRARPPGRAAYICGPAGVRPLRKGGMASVYAVGAAISRPPSLPPSRGKVPQCAHWGG